MAAAAAAAASCSRRCGADTLNQTGAVCAAPLGFPQLSISRRTRWKRQQLVNLPSANQSFFCIAQFFFLLSCNEKLLQSISCTNRTRLTSAASARVACDQPSLCLVARQIGHVSAASGTLIDSLLSFPR